MMQGNQWANDPQLERLEACKNKAVNQKSTNVVQAKKFPMVLPKKLTKTFIELSKWKSYGVVLSHLQKMGVRVLL